MTDFDDFLAPLDPPLVIVTTIHGGERSGCLVGFHCQASMEPLRYAVRISKANHTYSLARAAEHLAVHVVGVEDRALAELFGGETGDDVDKFDRCAWTPGLGGVPMLDDLPRRFVGRSVAVTDDGSDHVEVVLAPAAVDPGERTTVALRASALVDLDPGHPADDVRP